MESGESDGSIPRGILGCKVRGSTTSIAGRAGRVGERAAMSDAMRSAGAAVIAITGQVPLAGRGSYSGDFELGRTDSGRRGMPTPTFLLDGYGDMFPFPRA